MERIDERIQSLVTQMVARQPVLCGWLPRCKEKIDTLALVGCSLLSGLLTQSVEDCWP